MSCLRHWVHRTGFTHSGPPPWNTPPPFVFVSARLLFLRQHRQGRRLVQLPRIERVVSGWIFKVSRHRTQRSAPLSCFYLTPHPVTIVLIHCRTSKTTIWKW